MILASTLFGSGMVVVLFLISEKEIHRNNAFIRRIPPHPVEEIKAIDLKFNSYYIAGMSKDTLYLGNSTAPLNMIRISLKDYTIKRSRIILDQMDLRYRSIHILVRFPYFFAYDGSIPIIFRGKTSNWKAVTLIKGLEYFSLCEVTDRNTMAISSISSKNHEQMLGLINIENEPIVKFNTALLKKQIDGLFDVDGQLIWNDQLQRLVYLYYYRNQYLIINKDLVLEHLGKTVDTVQFAKIQVRDVNSKGQKKLIGKPVLINRLGATINSILFINSDRLGKYEMKKIRDKVCIIDTYDLNNNRYLFSFYLFHHDGKGISSMATSDDQFAVIMDDQLYLYRLKPKYFGKYLKIY